MPWHDVHCAVNGEAARDIAINFIQRWNTVNGLEGPARALSSTVDTKVCP